MLVWIIRLADLPDETRAIVEKGFKPPGMWKPVAAMLLLG
jgi:hypothetical protein